MPDDVPAAELRRHGSEYEHAAIKICTLYETVALLVFNDMMSFSMVRELTGGIAVVLWRKLRRWTAEVRAEQAQPSWAEWFQWLAEQLEAQNESKEAQPAYVRYSRWRPHS